MRYFLLILVFISSLASAQQFMYVKKQSAYAGQFLTYNVIYDSSIVGLVHSYSSLKENKIDSITFNSTGDLITYVGNDTVVLDGNTHVVVGNLVRFASPTGGLYYTILDTLTTSDTIILDQNVTADIDDEFYIGCIGTLNDNTGDNNASQDIAVRQPQLLWFNTDSVSIRYDGADDYMSMDNDLEFVDGEPWTVSTWIKTTNDDVTIIFYIGYKYNYGSLMLRYGGQYKGGLRAMDGSYTVIDESTQDVFDGQYHEVTYTCSGDSLYLYLDGELLGKNIINGQSNITYNRIGRAYGSDGLNHKGILDDVRMYNRELRAHEIQLYYEEGRFYKE